MSTDDRDTLLAEAVRPRERGEAQATAGDLTADGRQGTAVEARLVAGLLEGAGVGVRECP